MKGAELSEKLSIRSKNIFYDVFTYFEWPEKINQDLFWMDPSLTSVHANTINLDVTHEQVVRLSQLETINLFSIFCHGESALLQTILKNTLKPDLKDYAEYLSHFIDEENKHMWFFREFCDRYGNGLMNIRNLAIPNHLSADVERALSFLRILVFEEIGDYFNVRVMGDTNVPDIVRAIHERHHLDEVGHIAIGWKISEILFSSCKGDMTEVIETARKNIDSFMEISMQSFYSPNIYREVGLSDGYQVRESLLSDPGRIRSHEKILEKPRKKLEKMWSSILENSGQEA